MLNVELKPLERLSKVSSVSQPIASTLSSAKTSSAKKRPSACQEEVASGSTAKKKHVGPKKPVASKNQREPRAAKGKQLKKNDNRPIDHGIVNVVLIYN